MAIGDFVKNKRGTVAQWLAASSGNRIIPEGVIALVLDESGNTIYSVHGNGVDDIFDLPRNFPTPIIETSLPIDNEIVFDRDRKYQVNIGTSTSITIAPGGHTTSGEVVQTFSLNVQTGVTVTLDFSTPDRTYVTDDIGTTLVPNALNYIVLAYEEGTIVFRSNTVSPYRPVADETSPTIGSTLTLATNNSYVTGTFSEPVNSSTATALLASAFSINFTKGSDVTNTVTKGAVTKANGDALSTLISDFRINLTYDVPSNGDGTISVTVTNFEDASGNETASSTTSPITLNSAPLYLATIEFNGDMLTYFNETDPNSLLAEVGGKLSSTMTSGSNRAKGINRLEGKSSISKTLINGQSIQVTINNFTWGAVGSNGNQVLSLGILGSSGALAQITSAANPLNPNNYSALIGIGAGFVTNPYAPGFFVSTKGADVRLTYTYNSITPANSVVLYESKIGGVWTTEFSTTYDLGATVQPYITCQQYVGRDASNTLTVDSIYIN